MEQHHLISLAEMERKFRVYGPLLLAVFLLIFFYAMLLNESSVALRWILIPVFYSVMCWESSRLMVMFCRRRFPGIANTSRRMSLMILTGLPVAAIAGYIDHQFTFSLHLYSQIALGDYFFITGLHILCSAVAISIYESHYYLQEWKVLFLESENLKKQNNISQFQLLREQIKPHFLFNSLNTLSSLIATDTARAEVYVEEMSAVYRYLLNKNEKDLITLREEMCFLDSYLLLLRVRFEDSLVVEIAVDDHLCERLLPPFVLQLLIENAVKHNVISNSHPLSIKIYTEGENLFVENNIQLKARQDASEQKGLANIRLRYTLLDKQDKFSISQENGLFKITLPLLKSTRFVTVHLLND